MDLKCYVVNAEFAPADENDVSIDIPSCDKIVGHTIDAVPNDPTVASDKLLLGIRYDVEARDNEVGIAGTAISYRSGKLRFFASGLWDATLFSFSTPKHDFYPTFPFSAQEAIVSSVNYPLGNMITTGERSFRARKARLVLSKKAGTLAQWTFRVNVLIME